MGHSLPCSSGRDRHRPPGGDTICRLNLGLFLGTPEQARQPVPETAAHTKDGIPLPRTVQCLSHLISWPCDFGFYGNLERHAVVGF